MGDDITVMVVDVSRMAKSDFRDRSLCCLVGRLGREARARDQRPSPGDLGRVRDGDRGGFRDRR